MLQGRGLTDTQLRAGFARNRWRISPYFDISMAILVREALVEVVFDEADGRYRVTPLGRVLSKSLVGQMRYLENVYFGCLLPGSLAIDSVDILRNRAKRIEWVAAPLLALLVTAAGPAAAQTSCEVLVGHGVVAVYAPGPSDLNGDLCIERRCETLTVRKGWATDHRKVEAGDLVYFRPATGEKPCVGAAPIASAWLPQAMPAFISGALGLMATVLGMAGAFGIEAVKSRREASAKALDWLEIYGSRLDDVIRDARADPTPPPLPAAGAKVLAELRRRRRSASGIMAGLASDATRRTRVETAERAKAVLAADFKV